MKQVILSLLAVLILWSFGTSPSLAASQSNLEERLPASTEHPNIDILQKFNPRNIAESADVLSKDVVWHFFNPLLPDIQGDYVGLTGLQTFFEKIGNLTDGTFKVNQISASAIGDELIVVHTQNTMVFEEQPIKTDVVVVWRVVDGLITEVWDIPSVHASRDDDL
ncbi:MAG: nuclear transport factor 2 family protein [Cyanobacteria bacterium P01_H01_bin.153]